MAQQAITPLLGAAADPIVIECGGQRFTARLITQGFKTEWESQLRDLAMSAVLPLRSMDREAFLEAVARISEQSTQGMYGFHGDVSITAMGTSGGFLRLVGLIFSVDAEQAAVLVADAADAVTDALDQVMVRSYPKRAEAMRRAIAERKTKLAAEKTGEQFDPNQ